MGREVRIERVSGGVAITVPILAPMPPGLRVDSTGARNILAPKVSSPPRMRSRVRELLAQLQPVMEALQAAPRGSMLSPRGLTLVCPSAKDRDRVEALVELIEDVLDGPARGWGRHLGLFSRRGEGGMVLEGYIEGVQVRIEGLHLKPRLCARTSQPEGLVIHRAGEGPSEWRSHNPVADLTLSFSGSPVELTSEALEALLPVIHGHPGSCLSAGWLQLSVRRPHRLDELGEPLRLLLAATRRL